MCASEYLERNEYKKFSYVLSENGRIDVHKKSMLTSAALLTLEKAYSFINPHSYACLSM
jgi:hypothetical protein